MKHCQFCDAPLRDDKGRFEVRTAPGAPDHQWRTGVFCTQFCWEAACTRESVQSVMKQLICDAETVLGDEGQLMRREGHVRPGA